MPFCLTGCIGESKKGSGWRGAGNSAPAEDRAESFGMKDILGEALSLLIDHLEKKKGGKCRASDTPESHTRHIPRGISAELWNKAQNRCEYISPSGRRCDSEAFLEIDPITPYALGGSSTDPENLRVLCRTPRPAHGKPLVRKRMEGREDCGVDRLNW